MSTVATLVKNIIVKITNPSLQCSSYFVHIHSVHVVAVRQVALHQFYAESYTAISHVSTCSSKTIYSVFERYMLQL